MSRNEPEEFKKKKQNERFWGFNLITILVIAYIIVSAAWFIGEWQRHPKTIFSTASQKCGNECARYSFLPVGPMRLTYDDCLMTCEDQSKPTCLEWKNETFNKTTYGSIQQFCLPLGKEFTQDSSNNIPCVKTSDSPNCYKCTFPGQTIFYENSTCIRKETTHCFEYQNETWCGFESKNTGLIQKGIYKINWVCCDSSIGINTICFNPNNIESISVSGDSCNKDNWKVMNTTIVCPKTAYRWYSNDTLSSEITLFHATKYPGKTCIVGGSVSITDGVHTWEINNSCGQNSLHPPVMFQL
jgi:hypothetical protein